MAFSAPTLASEVVGHIGGFEVRNTMLMAWLAMMFILIISICARLTGYKRVPGKFQTLLEMIVEETFLFFNVIMQDEKTTRRIFPIAATIFFFIVIANWMGILPGIGSITIQVMHDGVSEAVPLFRSMNADVNMTLAIALIAFVCVQAWGIASLGFFKYGRKFLVFPWEKPYLIGTFVGFLEFIGEFTRLISFTFRLFGNIFAGEVLLVLIGFLVPYIAPIPFLGLEILVGMVQGLVFALLMLVFIKVAMTPGHSDEEHHDDDQMTKEELSKRVLNPS